MSFKFLNYVHNLVLVEYFDLIGIQVLIFFGESEDKSYMVPEANKLLFLVVYS